ncbi:MULTISPECIES: NAD(P)-dependent oxidoreductase [Campylobacter]|uniref:NAD(P)-dependent oxidoreductase n=1 Tax=Campylobacter TaxID=194 RepID=UPI0014729F01|nr:MULTISPECIES: NAD(P)-dependent oxidoreductase [unclassified Campylobacter]MBE3610267.1 NAD(P)-dependent oxidoreductase [Campylobacter sp. RM12916]
MKIGWIGLGAMGKPMASNLINAGFELCVYNRTASKTQELENLGAKAYKSIKELTQNSKFIFIMLSDGNAIREILTSKDGVLDALSSGQIIVNMSTISPLEAQEFHSLVKQKGCEYIDAPVSGSVGAAVSKTLLVLVSGESRAKELCAPYFKALSKASIDFRDSPKAAVAKLSINMLLGVFTQAMAESITFAAKLGLEKEKVLDMIGMSAMNTPLFGFKRELFATENFPSAFALELMSKDLGLLKQMMDEQGLNLPLSEISNKAYLQAKNEGLGKEDMSAILKTVKGDNR